MRIAFLSYAFEDRAMTSISFWLARELVKRGHQPTLVALSQAHRFRSEWRIQDGVRVLLTPRGITGRWHYDGWGPHDLLTRLVHVFSQPYDVLVAFDCRANVYLPFRATKGKVPVRIMSWGDRWGSGCLAGGASRFAFQRRLEEKWEKEMVTRADGVLASSQALGAVAREWGIPDARICWLPHGSPTDLIRMASKESARQRAGLKGHHPVMGYVGHTLGELTSFFPAFQRLAHRYPKMAILSMGTSSPRDREKVEQAGLTSYFRFTGFVPAAHLGDWLACADFFLLPLASNANNHYRYPGKLGEYMAAGRPVVAPEVGEVGRVVREEKLGVLVRPDLENLEERLYELAENPAHTDQLGAEARRVAEERFAWPVLTDRFEAFVSSLGGQSLLKSRIRE